MLAKPIGSRCNLDCTYCYYLHKHDLLPDATGSHISDGKGGMSSFDQACRAARLLQQYDVTFNTMTVINAVNAQHPAEVYRFLTEELGSRRLQLLACVEPKDF